LVGVWLVRHEGFVIVGRIRQQLDRGRVPGAELVEGFLLLVAGLLLIIPGFVSDAVGLLLVFPPTRALGGRLLQRRFRSRVAVYGLGPASDRVFGGPRNGPDDVIDV